MTRIMTGGLKSGNRHGYKGQMATAAARTRVPTSICTPLSVQFVFPFHWKTIALGIHKVLVGSSCFY
ncbi:hypothetical protein Hdeb2414_s0002g00081461 [Helianthus debilis subsp. tardiflorus]